MTATKSPIDAARAHLKAGASPSQQDLKAAIAALEAHAAEAEARLDDLGEKRERLLVSAGFREVDAADASIRAEKFVVDQSHAVLSEARRLLGQVAEQDRRAGICTARAAVETKMKASGNAMSRWPDVVGAAREILRAVAEADAAAERFARDFPNEPPIVRAEARVRVEPPARDLITQSEIWAWRHTDGRLSEGLGSHVLLIPEQARREPGHIARRMNRNILQEIESGEFKIEKGMIFKTHHGEIEVVTPVRAIRREFAVSMPTRPDALATDTKLPPLRAGDLGWDVERSDPDLVLAALNAEPRLGPAATIEVELQAIDEPARVLQLPAAAKAA